VCPPGAIQVFLLFFLSPSLYSFFFTLANRLGRQRQQQKKRRGQKKEEEKEAFLYEFQEVRH